MLQTPDGSNKLSKSIESWQSFTLRKFPTCSCSTNATGLIVSRLTPSCASYRWTPESKRSRFQRCDEIHFPHCSKEWSNRWAISHPFKHSSERTLRPVLRPNASPPQVHHHARPDPQRGSGLFVAAFTVVFSHHTIRHRLRRINGPDDASVGLVADYPARNRSPGICRRRLLHGMAICEVPSVSCRPVNHRAPRIRSRRICNSIPVGDH